MRVENFRELAPACFDAMMALEGRVADSELGRTDRRLLLLVKLRASQVNGCAYCIDMHSRELAELGEDEIRLRLLPAWDEAGCFSERERAALAWAESLTLLAQDGARDEVFERLARHFSPAEITTLTWQAITINGWNRLCRGLRLPPESVRRRQEASARSG